MNTRDIMFKGALMGAIAISATSVNAAPGWLKVVNAIVDPQPTQQVVQVAAPSVATAPAPEKPVAEETVSKTPQAKAGKKHSRKNRPNAFNRTPKGAPIQERPELTPAEAARNAEIAKATDELPEMTEEEADDIRNGQPILIEMDDLQMRLANTKKYLLIDVRRPREFMSGHIKGAINIPIDDISDEMRKLDVSRDTAIYLYCLSGDRALAAGQKLIKQGYVRVYDAGSIDDWEGPLVKGTK